MMKFLTYFIYRLYFSLTLWIISWFFFFNCTSYLFITCTFRGKEIIQPFNHQNELETYNKYLPIEICAKFDNKKAIFETGVVYLLEITPVLISRIFFILQCTFFTLPQYSKIFWNKRKMITLNYKLIRCEYSHCMAKKLNNCYTYFQFPCYQAMIDVDVCPT